MNIVAYKTTLVSRQTLKKFFSAFLQAFGALAIFLGVFDIFFPNTFGLRFQGLEILSAISFIWSIISVFPKFEISRQLMVPETAITIKVGDLFKEDANLVIGMSDTFDTEKGNIIKPKSVQGQFLTNIYSDNKTQLDSALSGALQGIHTTRDSNKSQGKKMRYEIGTVATLVVGSKKYFCSAYSYMGNDLKAQSNIQRLSKSLEMLWQEIRLKGQRDAIAMAVLGSDLARIGNTASHSNLIKLIVSSFILASRENPISEKLIIVVHPSNLKKVNMLELNDFLQNF